VTTTKDLCLVIIAKDRSAGAKKQNSVSCPIGRREKNTGGDAANTSTRKESNLKEVEHQ